MQYDSRFNHRPQTHKFTVSLTLRKYTWKQYTFTNTNTCCTCTHKTGQTQTRTVHVHTNRSDTMRTHNSEGSVSQFKDDMLTAKVIGESVVYVDVMLNIHNIINVKNIQTQPRPNIQLNTMPFL